MKVKERISPFCRDSHNERVECWLACLCWDAKSWMQTCIGLFAFCRALLKRLFCFVSQQCGLNPFSHLTRRLRLAFFFPIPFYHTTPLRFLLVAHAFQHVAVFVSRMIFLGMAVRNCEWRIASCVEQSFRRWRWQLRTAERP